MPGPTTFLDERYMFSPALETRNYDLATDSRTMDFPLNGILIDGVAMTASAAELNAISGGGLSAAELAVLDGVTPGTGLASKAVILDAGDDFIWPATGILNVSLVTATADPFTLTGLLGVASVGGAVDIVGGAGAGAGNDGGAFTWTTGAGVAETTGTGGDSGDITLQTGAAGGATIGTGGTGGTLSLFGAAGGAATAASGTGGVGGVIALTAGAGGAATEGSAAETGGAGGSIAHLAGAGGDSAAATSGVGGAYSATAGAGGAETSGIGGAAGDASLVSGAGGATTLAAGVGGAAGAVNLTGGVGGVDGEGGSGTGGVGGAVVLQAGAGGGGATAGVGAQVHLRSAANTPILTKRAVAGTGVDAEVLTVAELFNGVFLQNSSSGVTTCTTPAGQDISNALGPDLAVGDSFMFTLVNTGATTEVITFTASGGAGTVTITGSATVDPLADVATLGHSSGTFLFVNTASETWIAYRM